MDDSKDKNHVRKVSYYKNSMIKPRLLTSRNDRMQLPVDNKYIVSVTQPVTVYVTLDPRYTTTNFPSWISSQGWIQTTLTANSSATASNWSIHKKDFPAGTITLGVDTQGYDGVTYIFVKQPVSPTPKPGDTNNDSVNIQYEW